jgi:hypothetical protein
MFRTYRILSGKEIKILAEFQWFERIRETKSASEQVPWLINDCFEKCPLVMTILN